MRQSPGFANMFQASVAEGLANTLGAIVMQTLKSVLSYSFETYAEKPSELHREKWAGRRANRGTDKVSGNRLETRDTPRERAGTLLHPRRVQGRSIVNRTCQADSLRQRIRSCQRLPNKSLSIMHRQESHDRSHEESQA